MSILDMRSRSGSDFGYTLAYHLEQGGAPPGDTYISTSDLAVILGIPFATLAEQLQEQGDDFTVPDTWVAAGRRRVAQAEAVGAITIPEIVAHLRGAA